MTSRGRSAVHLASGIWGTLALRFGNSGAALVTGLSRWQQFLWQVSVLGAGPGPLPDLDCAAPAQSQSCRSVSVPIDEAIGLNGSEAWCSHRA